MRCSKCGRLPKSEAPKRVFPCMCSKPTFDPDKCGEHTGLTALRALIAAASEEMVAAIRADKVVGKGTCSSIAECWEDREIITELKALGITTCVDALRWAREQEDLHNEQGLNQRWGEDDDPQLEAYNRFNKANDENPLGAPSRNDGLGLEWDD